jgi:hypothetical protein
MRFGTYYFLQAPPFIPHPDVVRREIEQMVWTEELGFTALRGMPMLNSLLRGPVHQLAPAATSTSRRARRPGEPARRSRASSRAGACRVTCTWRPPTPRRWPRRGTPRCGTRSRCGAFSSRSASIEGTRCCRLGSARCRSDSRRSAGSSSSRRASPSAPPHTVAERVDEFRRLGVGEMLCWMNFGGLPQDRVRRSMELFAREVMPRFR